MPVSYRDQRRRAAAARGLARFASTHRFNRAANAFRQAGVQMR